MSHITPGWQRRSSSFECVEGGAVRGHGGLAFRLPQGDAYTYALDGQHIRVEPGDDHAETVIELAHDAWEGLVHDYESAPGLLYAGRLKCVRGQAMKFVA